MVPFSLFWGVRQMGLGHPHPPLFQGREVGGMYPNPLSSVRSSRDCVKPENQVNVGAGWLALVPPVHQHCLLGVCREICGLFFRGSAQQQWSVCLRPRQRFVSLHRIEHVLPLQITGLPGAPWCGLGVRANGTPPLPDRAPQPRTFSCKNA